MAFIVDFPSFKRYTYQPVKYVQPKLDGHLIKIHKGKTLTLLTKNDKIITDKVLAIPHLKELMDKVRTDADIWPLKDKAGKIPF